MGCATSRVENGEVVSRCKARRRYMKHAVASRHAFAAGHAAYLQALRNTGAALSQFADGEAAPSASAAADTPATTQTVYRHRRYPTLPPTRHAPPPPPPPELSSTESSYGGSSVGCDSSTPVRPMPPPPIPPWCYHAATPTPPPDFFAGWEQLFDGRSRSSEWDEASERHYQQYQYQYQYQQQQQHPQPPAPAPAPPPVHPRSSDWEDSATNATATTDASYDRAGAHCDIPGGAGGGEAPKSPEPQTDDNSSMVSSWIAKDDSVADMAVIIAKTRKDLASVIRVLDEFFLRAHAAGQEVSRLLETNRVFGSLGAAGAGVLCERHQHSAKVLSALSLWGWPSKSLSAFGRDLADFSRDDCASGYGSHCSTLERIYAWEKKLYCEVRNREFAKAEHDRKVALLRKQELKGDNELKIEKTKATIKRLQSQIMVAVQAVETTSAAILKLRDEELYPQLVEISRGLMNMWRSMYECHQEQSKVVQQLRHLDNLASTEATTSCHRQATIQLEAQVTAWYDSFCKLIKSQRDYIRALNGWLRLTINNQRFKNDTDGYIETYQQPLYALCEEWQLALDRLPEQSACGGIKSFITVIHAIVVQQSQEYKLARKAQSLSKELEKKMLSLRNMETKYYDPYATPERREGGIDPRDPLSRKKAKTEALRRRVEEENSRHLKSISVSRAMTLNNLQTGLPNVFQAITGFSNVCTQAFEAVHNQAKAFNNISSSSNSCLRRLT